jgi:hypothetical protein
MNSAINTVSAFNEQVRTMNFSHLADAAAAATADTPSIPSPVSVPTIPSSDQVINLDTPTAVARVPNPAPVLPTAPATEVDPRLHELRKLKEYVEELLDALEPDDPEVDVPQIDEDGDLDEQLKVLREFEAQLIEILNDEAEETPSASPKFGKFDGPLTTIRVVGRKKPVVVDVDGVVVDSGERVQVTPEVQAQIDLSCQFFADEKRIAERDAKKEAQVYDGDEYPVRILPQQAGPTWDDKILYGIAGDIVRKVSAHCESHPAGMLLDFLVSFGSILGRGPYFNINATKHYTNEFMCRVGDSSKSRKGTGRDAIDEVLKQIAPSWFSSRVISGFGSSEAIIAQIKDTTIEMREHKGVVTPNVIHGVEDKRLYIREGELASVFVLAGKAESRADIVLRDGWDGKPLRNIVKGKTKEGFSNSAKCEEPHISISGDTTIHELRRKMPQGSDENGFGNRFMYVYVYRVKDCPLGGPPLDWSKEIEQLFLTIHWAKQVRYVSMTDAARQWWIANYHNLEHEGPVGLAGKMTARGAAHLRRLAMIYALLDKRDQIDTIHFKAAKRLWDYCSESAVFIFGGATAEQLRIVNWIGFRQNATYKQVRDELYRRNKPVDQIKNDLAALVKNDMLQLAGEVYSKGRSAPA